LGSGWLFLNQGETVMKIKCFEYLKTKMGIPEKTFVFLTFFAIVYPAGCLALLVPVFQNLVIMFGEFLARRPLNHPVWRERFISWGLSGIVLYILFFIVFFLENGLRQKNHGRRIYLCVIIFVILGVFAVMFQANWTFGDDHEYITTTAVNKYVPFHHYITGGRFDPLSHFHYNIPLFLFRFLGINSGLPVEAHFTLIALFYSVSVICLFSLFNKIEPSKGRFHPVFSAFFACTFFLLGSSFCSVFMSLIFPETQGIMLFTVFMLMYYRALETAKKRYYIAAFIAAVYNSYCKEPVFGAFLAVAISNLLFGYKKQSKREKIFYAALVVNAVVFIVLYYLISFRNAVGFYNEGRVDLYGLRFIGSILSKTPLLIVMIIFGFFRFGVVIIKRDREHLYYDSLLFAGIAYTFAYMLLHLNAGYYFLPSIILFLPSLVYWIKYLYQTRKHYALPAFGFIMIIYLLNIEAALGIAKTWKDRKEFIPYISSLLSNYNRGKKFIWYESDNTITGNTFYRAVRGWRKYIENAFLNYKNKSEGKEFFILSKNKDEIGSYKNALFFYPLDNDQNQPMPDALIKTLADNNFRFLTDSYGILIYKQYE
jgi:hypothetical protein